MKKEITAFLAYFPAVLFVLYFVLVALGGCASDSEVPGSEMVPSNYPPVVEVPEDNNEEVVCPPLAKHHHRSHSSGNKALQDKIAALQAENAQLKLDLETLAGALDLCEADVCPEPEVCPEAPSCEETVCPEAPECPVEDDKKDKKGDPQPEHGNDDEHGHP